MGEQPNPWDLLQPQDDEPTSRCQTSRRYELLGRSACYPQSTFYPLSDGPSMQNHRITISNFSSLLDLSVSQSSTLMHCTPRTITNRAEGPLKASRYTFGRRPPQSNYPAQCPGFWGVRHQENAKGGISPLALNLAARDQRLPPIPHIILPIPM